MSFAFPPTDASAVLADAPDTDHPQIVHAFPEPLYDDMVRLAAQICETPFALISLVSQGSERLKASVGLQSPAAHGVFAFCTDDAVASVVPLAIEDTRSDSRLVNNPLVAHAPHIRFYAGVPIFSDSGAMLGTVHVVDTRPRQLSVAQSQALGMLARQVGQLLRLHALTDDAERKRHEGAEAHRQQIEHLLAIAVSDRDLASYVDRSYTYRYVNQTYLQYWLLERSAIEGHTVAALMGEAAFQGIAKPRLDRALGGETVQYQSAFDFPGRGRRFVDATYMPAREADGSIVGVVVRVHDIDELKQIEERLRSTVAQLEERSLSQERLMYTLSHDLREPVNTLINFSSLLSEGNSALSPAEIQTYLGFVRSGSLRLRKMQEDLLDFVRLDRELIEWEFLDLNELVRECLLDLGDAISRSRASIRSDVLPQVIGQRTLVRLVIQNLLANAIKFVAVGTAPRVDVSAAITGAFCQLTVADNGIGIPEGQRSAVFELFKRLHSRKAYEGTGLGLAMCRRVAELHGGRIWIGNTASGDGSCFHVTLPLEANALSSAPG